MARRLTNPGKKLRGAARRLRAIQRWPAVVEGWFPEQEDLLGGQRYWNWKIPVDLNLVEGRYTTDDIRRICAQSMIDTCANLIAAKPAWADRYRVTCVICLPDMFTSELCIYLDEEYFRTHVQTDPQEEALLRAGGRMLSTEWRLILPADMHECGVPETWEDEDGSRIEQERWYFGEVALD